MKLRGWMAGMAVLAGLGPLPAYAGVIRSPVAVVGDTLGLAGGSTLHLIDQSGLSVNFISGVTDFETYINLGPTHAVVSATTGWASSTNKLPGYLEFDLGNVYAISNFVLWTQNSTLAVDAFSLSSALDAAFTAGVTNLGSFNATVGLNSQSFAVSGVGEFVRLQINSSHGPNQVNLGEVAFETIPEPGSLTLLATMLGVLGFIRRNG